MRSYICSHIRSYICSHIRSYIRARQVDRVRGVRFWGQITRGAMVQVRKR